MSEGLNNVVSYNELLLQIEVGELYNSNHQIERGQLPEQQQQAICTHTQTCSIGTLLP